MSDLGAGHWKHLTIGFEEALSRLPDALKSEGFGVITEIDMKATLKAKLGVEFRSYKILGACNPTFAHKALMLDPRVGVLLPCNVVLYENDDGSATLGAVDPLESLGASSGAVGQLASEIGAKLDRVLASMPGKIS